MTMRSLESPAPLSEARRELERTLWELRQSLGKTFGLPTAGRPWALPLLAAGVGLTIALSLKRRARRRRKVRGRRRGRD